MKKIMLLGGNYFQTTAIKAAKELGYHVISVDYLPDNPGHKYADEYHNVSTTDREAVLALAKRLEIDGIVSYASDVSAPTAAYVAEQMGLPTNPLSAVEILTQKDRMRRFMETHDFLTPKGAGFTAYDEAFSFFQDIKKPAMVKPVDSSGSKGVSKIFEISKFQDAWNSAMAFSRCGKIIVEEFLAQDGYRGAGDAFIVDGKVVFAGWTDPHFDRLCNPLVPTGDSYPSILSEDLKKKVLAEIQRLLTLLDMKMGAVNLEFIVDKSGGVYILEVGPRSGGGLIADIIYESEGVDLAKNIILAALGEKVTFHQPQKQKFVSAYMIHSIQDGKFNGIKINDKIRKNLIRFDVWVKPGEQIKRYDNAGLAIGAAIISHESIEEMCLRMDHMEEYIEVILE